MSSSSPPSFLYKFIGTKFGKILFLVLVAGMIAAASASVSTFYYGNATANVHTPDVQLLAGSDSSSICSSSPCVHVSTTTTGTSAIASLSLFPSAMTYYTNISVIRNSGTSLHEIKNVQIINVNDPSNSLGRLTVYYCTTQTEFTSAGRPVTPSSCVGNYSLTNLTPQGGYISGSFPLGIAPSTTQYIEICANASSSATIGSTSSFTIAIQWN